MTIGFLPAVRALSRYDLPDVGSNRELGDEPVLSLRRKERPRAVVVGLIADDSVASQVRELFPYAAFVGSFSLIRQADYDVVILIDEQPPGLTSASHVVWLPNDARDRQDLPLNIFCSDEPGVFPNARLTRLGGNNSLEFDFGPEAESLAPTALLETLQPEDLDYEQFAGYYLPPERVTVRPLLVELGDDGAGLATVLERTDTRRQVWALPHRAVNHLKEWLAAAIQQWREHDPDAFPSVDWVTEPEWMDHTERDLADELRQHDKTAQEAIARLDAERQILVERQSFARLAANQGIRRLLATNSDDLVDAVMKALDALGFQVINADEIPRPRRFEDLRVSDGEWVCLAEVKGYEKRNAKTADLMQLAGAVANYQRDHPPPSAQWYVINQSFASHPGLRRRPFESDPDTVKEFALNDGLVIDTRDLFRLVTQVESQLITRDDARDLLRRQRGVLELGPQSAE